MDFGSPTLNAIGAVGYAITRVVLIGLQTTGGWVFLILATLSLSWSCVRPAAPDDAPGSLVRHCLAVAFAAVFLYGPMPVDLSAEVGGRLSADGPALTQGAAPLPTYYVDQIGQAINRTAKAIVSTDTSLLVPSLALAMRDATANPENLADAQVRANLQAWRTLAAAALTNDSAFAKAIASARLMERLMNPVVLDPIYTSAKAVAEMEAVIRALDALPVNAQLGANFCNNVVQLNELIERAGAAAWTHSAECAEPSGALSTSILSATTTGAIPNATSAPGISDPALRAKADAGIAQIQAVLRANESLTGATRFASMSELYRALGAGALVSATVQAAQSNDYKILLGELCQQKGPARCAQALAPSFGELDRVVSQPERSWWGRLTDTLSAVNVWKSLATGLAAIVAAFATLYAKLVSALTPFGVAMARALAILLSVLGIFLLLLPNRARDGIVWLIAPVAFANLWGTLYIFWWKICDLITDWGWKQVTLNFSTFITDDSTAALTTLYFVTAIGYTSLPFLAWSIVFALTERLAPKSGVGGMLAPVAQVISASMRTYAVGAMVGRAHAAQGGAARASGAASGASWHNNAPGGMPANTSRGG